MDINQCLPIINSIVNKHYYNNDVMEREDVLHECVIVVMNLLTKNNNDDSFFGYINKHLYHHIKKLISSDDVMVFEEVKIETPSEEDRLMEHEAMNVIESFYQTLTVFDADIFNHAIIEQDMKLTAIARKHGKSEKTVYSKYSRVYNNFVNYITGEYDDVYL